MKYPEYDSPLEYVVSDIATQIARNIDDLCWQAIQRVGVNVNKDKLILALKHDSARYREAFRRGEETGYTKRSEEIVRCKDCRYRDPEDHKCDCGHDIHWELPRPDDWFCADGKRKECETDESSYQNGCT